MANVRASPASKTKLLRADGRLIFLVKWLHLRKGMI